MERDGPSHLPVEYELREKKSSESFRRDQNTWGKTSSYELKDSTKLGDLSEPADVPMDENAYRRSAGKMKRKLSDPEIPTAHLIQLDSPVQPSREVLFSAPMASTVPSSVAEPPISPRLVAESSPSIPASPDARLAFSTISFDTATDHWADVRVPPSSRPEDDVLSLADTNTSGYEDAETYSPVSGARTPARLHLSATGSEMPVLSPPFIGLGLENVETRRGPLSVVSLSESEGWAADSDWATGSEAGL